MRESKEVEIGSNKYQITQFGGRMGWKLGKKVSKILLPAMSKAFSEDGEEMNLAKIFEVVAEHLDELDDQTITDLLSHTTVNKYALDFDNHFAGNYGELLMLLWEIVMFNYESVFSMATVDTDQSE